MATQKAKLQIKNGLAANINAADTLWDAQVGEPAYTTDSKVLYIFDGVNNIQAGMRYTETTADPTTTEIPNDKEFGLHKNTTSGNVYLAFNNGGTILKVQLS
jgi:hypothetical protein